MMLILGLDFETTGLDTAKDRPIEVGAVLWDTATAAPLALLSELTWRPEFPEVTPEITAITGIERAHLELLAYHPRIVFERLLNLMSKAEAIVAHNGTSFDRPVYEAELARLDLGPLELAVVPAEIPWVDTMTDVPYPDRMATRKLGHLAAEHGFVNPFPHRAVFDVLTMLKVLSQYDMNDVLAISQSPTVELLAQTEKPWQDAGRSTDAAKARGFRWNGERKVWAKLVKKCRLERELAQVAGVFQVSVSDRAS